MSIQVIAMLTYNDQTVPDALSVFEANKHANTNCWGFKDIGITTEDAVRLVAAMKAAGKTTFLEPLLEDEASCLNAANMAVHCGFDCVVSMVYNPEVANILKAGNVSYVPTCGHREGLPRMLYGTTDEIVADAKDLIMNKGMEGVCLSSYRYVDGDPESMSLEFKKRIQAKLIVSGGINDYHRLDFVKKLNPWGFTIGSALFDHKFGKELSIAEQLNKIQEYIGG